MLSNKESKYRIKIITENHLNKDGQRYLDQYVGRKLLTYKTLYLNFGFLHSMLCQYNLSKLSNAMRGFGDTCAKAANALQVLTSSALQALTASLRPLGDYEKCTYLERDNFKVSKQYEWKTSINS